MTPYNRFKRNNAQVIQRYNAPSIRQNSFSESCRRLNRRTHWAHKTRAEAQAQINRLRNVRNTWRNFYIEYQPDPRGYNYAVGFEEWSCNPISQPKPKPNPPVKNPIPTPKPGDNPTTKQSTWDKIVAWFRNLWSKVKGDQSDSSVIDYLKDKWWLVLVGIIVILGIMR